MSSATAHHCDTCDEMAADAARATRQARRLYDAIRKHHDHSHALAWIWCVNPTCQATRKIYEGEK